MSHLPPELAGAYDEPEPTSDRERKGGRRRRIGSSLLGGVATLAAVTLVLAACGPLGPLLEADPPLERPVEPGPAEIVGDAFGEQEPNWVLCHGEMQCAEVFAPMDWNDLEGERITLALVKQPAKSGTSLGTIFVNPGGPGGSGYDYVASSIDFAVGQPLQEHYDIVGWDPRGVGLSSPVTCLSAEGMDEYLFGASVADDHEVGSERWVALAARETAEYGEACLDSTGDLLNYVDTISTVHDLDMLRAIVGDEKLNYLGYSYGTYIGARYADHYPEHVGKLVLDGAIDPTVSMAEMVRSQTVGFEAALRAYVTDCLTDDDCPFSGSVDDAMNDWRELLEKVEAEPLLGADGRWLSVSTLLTAIVTPLYSPNSWSYLDELYTATSAGNPWMGLLLADVYYGRTNGEYEDNSNEAFSAINCLDYPASNDIMSEIDRMRAEAAELSELAPTIGKYQGYGDVFCASWPAKGVTERAPVTAAGADPILVVGTTGDPATPYHWSVALAEQLESGVLVTFNGEGHTAYGKSTCVGDVVEQYFLEGAVPSADPQCAV